MDWEIAAKRAEVAEWRSRHLLAAERRLNDLASALLRDFEPHAQAAGWRDLVVAPEPFVARVLGPALRERAEPVVGGLLEEAGRDLAGIAVAAPDRKAAGNDHEESLRDAVLTAAPLATGLAAAAAIPAAAVTTGTAYLGLVAVTTIAWPVAAAGGAIAAVALATGAVNGSWLREKAVGRLRERARGWIAAALLDDGGEPASVLAQLRAGIERAAEEGRG